MSDVVKRNRLKWLGHVLRNDDGDWVKKCMSYEMELRAVACWLLFSWGGQLRAPGTLGTFLDTFGTIRTDDLGFLGSGGMFEIV